MSNTRKHNRGEFVLQDCVFLVTTPIGDYYREDSPFGRSRFVRVKNGEISFEPSHEAQLSILLSLLEKPSSDYSDEEMLHFSEESVRIMKKTN